MAKRSEHRYTGSLAKPLPPHHHTDSQQFLEGVEQHLTDYTERIVELARNLDVGWQIDDPPFWQSLACRLAERHVPGLRPIGRRGAPRRWSVALRAMLLRDVLGLQKSELAACIILLSRDPWRRKARNPATLLRRVQEAKGERDEFKKIQGFPRGCTREDIDLLTPELMKGAGWV